MCVVCKKIVFLLVLICLIFPFNLNAASEHYELHFAVNLVGTYSITKALEHKKISKWTSRGIAVGIMTAASLYKEYVYDTVPDKNDLLFDALGISTALIVLEF